MVRESRCFMFIFTFLYSCLGFFLIDFLFLWSGCWTRSYRRRTIFKQTYLTYSSNTLGQSVLRNCNTVGVLYMPQIFRARDSPSDEFSVILKTLNFRGGLLYGIQSTYSMPRRKGRDYLREGYLPNFASFAQNYNSRTFTTQWLYQLRWGD